eukprot:COSAG01_NODE_4675_length_4825_cov_7.495768_5_plen_79_part_00
MQELQFEFFVPLEHAEAAMQATYDVTKDWHLPVKCDPDGRPFANCELPLLQRCQYSATASHLTMSAPRTLSPQIRTFA